MNASKYPEHIGIDIDIYTQHTLLLCARIYTYVLGGTEGGREIESGEFI